jgi:S-DNA-T family DNA segregation ATPase FtsK/SpoIIIE
MRLYDLPRPRRPRVPRLEPHQIDLLGLGLLALGVFLALVLWFGSAGGEAGAALRTGMRFLIGAASYAVPAALGVVGVLIVGRTLMPPARPLRTGTVCLLLATLLALAGGTLGIGPDGTRHGYFHREFFEPRGGALGEALYWAAAHAVSTTGAHILALFGWLAGFILVSGATVAGAIRAARAHAERATTVVQARRAGRPVRSGTTPVLPPEPDSDDLVVRAMDPDGDAEVDLAPEPEEQREHDDPEPPLDDPEPAEVDPGRLTPQGRYRAEVTDDPEFPWRIPPPRVLTRSRGDEARPDTRGQSETATRLVEALGHFGVEAKIVGTVAGPHITRYELRLAPGTKVAKVANLKDDLAYALAAADIRIQAPIPGKQAVGVEVPNLRRRIVHLGDVLHDPPADWSPLAVWLGKDVSGRAIGADLAKMPHLLVAGTTGAGKSGCVNAMLSSILLRATPHNVRMVLVDPKQVELTHYEGIPHLLTPVITSPRMAANALGNLVREMEERYALMSLARTRSLPELNRAREARSEPDLPYILCVIDELADLMMVAPADVEDSIIRLAQKARAVGIHLVLATQSPRVDVITGMIKANVPSRIAFAVSSQTDSRVILDSNGAETLLGQGDMLFSPVGTSKLQRIQGAYVDEAQIAAITTAWKEQGAPELREELLDEVPDAEGAIEVEDDGFDPDEDPLLEEAIALVASMGTASTSMLQRRLRLGYTRAGRLIDMLERRGVISGYEGSKPRQVLITEADLPRILQNMADPSAAAASPAAPDEG